MAIAFYRNILNAEMKNFGRFSKRVTETLVREGQEVNVIFDPKKDYCLEQIKKHETIIIISHGSADTIFHKYDHSNEMHQILLNRDNIGILQDKKVIAISCGTARILGSDACQIGGCRAYLGFFNKIHFDKLNKKKASRKYYIFVADCYKDVFAKIIEQAIRNEWTFDKLQEVLSIELRKTVTERALSIQKDRPQYFKNHGLDQAVLAVSNVAANMMVFGDVEEKIS
ncbi:hypothetical protein B9C88_17170 [Brevibacillus laterosporus]|uniref:hypothetical protein n=1 Tax=Brevibacillus laterosporus TaxID=1465 RepID=UPI000BC61373|nr:hypothetical protein [Brevibacillus laterosporus]PCN43181.1 hypothetical protein B9C88_17170 [Brevibacillus laterosporus]